ncbi:hypothetical protein [Olsenella uli]|uniref:hypothetical protein n=1 Tax=Olsenella uli TaxID=133926 RepID=UPI00325FB637
MDMFAGTIASTSVGMFAIPAGPALALGSTLFATGASLRLEECPTPWLSVMGYPIEKSWY